MLEIESRRALGQRLSVGFDGFTVPDGFARLVREYKVGNVILFRRNIQSADQLRRLCADLTGLILRETGLPPFIMLDEECGSVSRLAHIGTPTPSAMAIGATGDPANAYAVGRMIGEELRAVGVNFNLAPILDVNTNPLNPVIGIRSFGGDPAKVAEMGVAYARGLQEAGVVACGKHFPGHGDTATDSHIGLPLVDKTADEVRRMELVSFRAAIAAGIDAIMSAHVIFPALEPDRVPSTVSRRVLTGLLRGELGFAGLIVSDGMEMRAVMDMFGIEDATCRALNAGVDVALICHSAQQATDTIDYIERAVAAGTFDLAQNDASYARIAAAKARLNQTPSDPAAFGSEAHKAQARAILRDAIRVLHAPEDQPLPDMKDALFFGAANRQASQASDAEALDAARECARLLGGTYVPTAVDRRDELLARAAGMKAVLLLAHNAPDLAELIALGNALAEAGARVTAVAMTTPYCLDAVSGKAWKLAVYQYDMMGVSALADVLRG